MAISGAVNIPLGELVDAPENPEGSHDRCDLPQWAGGPRQRPKRFQRRLASENLAGGAVAWIASEPDGDQ